MHGRENKRTYPRRSFFRAPLVPLPRSPCSAPRCTPGKTAPDMHPGKFQRTWNFSRRPIAPPGSGPLLPSSSARSRTLRASPVFAPFYNRDRRLPETPVVEQRFSVRAIYCRRVMVPESNPNPPPLWSILPSSLLWGFAAPAQLPPAHPPIAPSTAPYRASLPCLPQNLLHGLLRCAPESHTAFPWTPWHDRERPAQPPRRVHRSLPPSSPPTRIF